MEGVEYHIGGVGCSTYAGCKIPSVCRWLCGCLSSFNKRRLCNCQDQSVNGKKVFYIIRPLERKCIRGRIGCFAGRPEVSIRHRKLRSSIRRSPCSSSSSRSSRDRCQRSSLRMQVSTAHLLKGSKAD